MDDTMLTWLRSWPRGQEVAERIELLRAALDLVGQHKPGTPGLHYDSLELLIDSATTTAIVMLTDDSNRWSG